MLNGRFVYLLPATCIYFWPVLKSMLWKFIATLLLPLRVFN